MAQKENGISLIELHQILPHGWQAHPTSDALKLIGPDAKLASLFATGAKTSLQQIANRLGFDLLVYGSCGSRVGKFKAARRPQESRQEENHQETSSYAPRAIAPTASFDEVLDFIKGKKAEGLVVTVTSMVDDKCLIVNDLQAIDRGGGWTAQDWVGLDFKKLWIDSLRSGPNFYGDLVERVVRDRRIPNFYYHIRRPSGAKAEYSSTYHYLENFMGAPVRIAVSKQGEWRIIEDGHLEG